MSTNKLSHLKEWDKIYLEVTRELSTSDDDNGLMFRATSSYATFVDDNDTFYTLEELKTLANDGMPKQGEIYIVNNKAWCGTHEPVRAVFVCNYKWKNIFTRNWFDFEVFYEFELPKQKTELTLAEIEEKLGIEKGSLIIKD